MWIGLFFRNSENSLPVLEGSDKKEREGLLPRAWSDRTRGDGFKVTERRFRFVVGRNSFL